ncbi:MAG TPA: glycosyltransferase family 9 protein [Acidobacteriota bacterium]
MKSLNLKSLTEVRIAGATYIGAPLPSGRGSAGATGRISDSRIEQQIGQSGNILLVRLRSLGDSVLMTPIPRIVKQWRPGAKVSVLIEEPFAGVFKGNPCVDEVLAIPRCENILRRIRRMAAIRRRKFDLVFNMHSGTTAGLFALASGAAVRVAYASARYARKFNVRVPPSEAFWEAPIHTVEHQLSPLMHLGIPVPEKIELELHPDGAVLDKIRSRIRDLGLSPEQFLLMHPFATLFTKEWELSRYSQLAGRLRERYGRPVIATAGPAETGKMRRLKEMAGDSVIGLENLELPELIGWISQCGLFIGNDSGPTHVAAALKRKIVVIWGSSDYRAWHPWGVDYQLLRADLPCIPCPGYRCYEFDSPKCIESISVEHVLHAVERMRPFA